jgi:protein-S-isoprenylcysteine O-methyltransferase Ste14
MSFILLGCLGFGFVVLFDFLSLWGKARLKILFWILGFGLIGYATVMVCLTPDRLDFPLWVTITGGVLTLLFACSLIYTLFINLPFMRTYYRVQQKTVLIRSGGYALTRHPGVLALTLLLLSLLPLSAATLLFIAIPVFVFANIITVVIEDKYIFPRLFPEYVLYRKETPMLIPNKKSLKAFLRSWNKV